MSLPLRTILLTGTLLGPVAYDASHGIASAQGKASVNLDEISVTAPRDQSAAPGATGGNVSDRVPGAAPAGAEADNPAAVGERRFSAARDRIFTKAGATVTTLDRGAIEALPQGDNQRFDQLVLQLPGVTQDTASNGSFHVRNEHGNVQYRINGVLLPDAVSGFNQFLDPAFVGSVSLVTGALPAEFGLRTAGLLDIRTRTGAFEGGSVSLYGGVRGTLTPSFQYGGHIGATDYFVSSRYFRSNVGIENTTPSFNPIHDHTEQGKFFGYVSSQLDEATRLTYITGTSVERYQIPNTPGLSPSFTAFGQSAFNSARIDERQNEFTTFNVLALQRSMGDVDVQLSYFQRYTTLHFKPDALPDLLFNGVASDVYRSSLTNGVQGDASWQVTRDHTLRFGFFFSAEQTLNNNNSLLLPTDANGIAFDAPFSIDDRIRKTGILAGGYVQDEWKITDRLILNTGLRFDQMYQYVDANQLSPRVSATWTPFDGTVFHAGYARYFTPPQQISAAPTNLALVGGSTQQPGVPFNSPVQPERADYYDVGVVQTVLPGFDVGVDAYLKLAHNLLDDGQFGAAYVLSAFNYARATNQGVEIKAKYVEGNFSAYGNVAFGYQKGRLITSNQFLFDPDALAYIATHAIYTDHSQITTASGGVSYLWEGTRLSADAIFGSGLRAGFANTSHVPSHVQVNLGLSREVQLATGWKPATFRVDVVNLLDDKFQLRDGSGIGVFAPQYGPRRGVFAGIAQAF